LGGNTRIGTDQQAGTLEVKGTLSIGGAGNPGKALTVHGVTDLQGELTVATGQPTTLGGTLTVTSATTLSSLSVTGNVGVGITTTPAKLLHVEGGEFRVRASHNNTTADIGTFYANNLTQGIGIGYNRLEAIGSNANQDIMLVPKGTGIVNVGGKLTLQGQLTLSENTGVEFASTAQATIVWNSKVNAGGDKAFVLFKDNSTYLSPQGTAQECVRLSIGVFNDFGNDAKFLDALDIQGGARLTLNAGTWDTELNTAIGAPGGGDLLQGISFRINDVEKMRLDKDGKLGITESLGVGPFTLPNYPGRFCVTGSVAEIGFVKRTLTAWPASAQAGDRFLWYNPDGTARLWTEARGDLVTVTSDGKVGIGTPTSPGEKLEVRGSIKLGASGELFATAGVENLRILCGTVNPNGTVFTSTGGCSIRRINTGLYDIVFAPQFAATPVVVLTQQFSGGDANANNVNGDGGDTRDNCTVVGVSPALVRVKCGASGGDNADRRFEFIAIGPR
jgi:hypothetical protein